mgnify:CR=1 FL=1
MNKIFNHVRFHPTFKIKIIYGRNNTIFTIAVNNLMQKQRLASVKNVFISELLQQP